MTRRREASRPVRRRARQEAKSNGRHSGHAAGGLVWYKSRLLPCHQEIVCSFRFSNSACLIRRRVAFRAKFTADVSVRAARDVISRDRENALKCGRLTK